MSISPVGSGARVAMDGMNGGPGGARRMRAVLDSVSQLFGMSPQSLAKEIESGKSMMDIAADKGISPMDLLKTIRTAMLMATPSPDEGPVANRQLDKAASKIAHHVGSIAGSGHTSGQAATTPSPTLSAARTHVDKLL